jgi:hypothetical protein
MVCVPFKSLHNINTYVAETGTIYTLLIGFTFQLFGVLGHGLSTAFLVWSAVTVLHTATKSAQL